MWLYQQVSHQWCWCYLNSYIPGKYHRFHQSPGHELWRGQRAADVWSSSGQRDGGEICLWQSSSRYKHTQYTLCTVSVNYDAISLCFISQEQRHPLVAGSVGPYGAFLLDGSEYTGAYAEEMSVEVSSSQMLILVTNEVIMQMFIQMFHLWTHLLSNFFFSSSKELKAWHRPHVECLAAAGADLVAFETIPSIKEAEALVELLREFPNSKAWLAFSCKVTTAAEQYN